MMLSDETFLIYAAKHYDMRKSTGVDEFYDDLKRFQYLKKLFKRYIDNDDLKLRLILNHIIVLYNCFDEMATPMLFLKLEEFHEQLKPILVFLKRMPPYVEYENTFIYTSNIGLDQRIVDELRKI